jgi:LysR family transcriptional regulator, chromosome initiation inhibitor
MFDYKLIQAFAMVIQESGFERAAARMHITQSAISQRVKQLEDQLGQVLLLRTSPPMPTDPGKQVLKLFNQVRHLENEFKMLPEPDKDHTFIGVPIGINADTLDTWFFEAVQPFLDRENVLLDLFVDDQERTHHFLRDGKVLACISTRDTAVQGCRVTYIGEMTYGLYCTQAFGEKWFPQGLTFNSLEKAPVLCFTRDDKLNIKILEQIFGTTPRQMPTHYIPSSVMFISLVRKGLAYGMLPEHQSHDLVKQQHIIDLAPEHRVKVKLYWHCWNLNSKLLKTFTSELLAGFKRVNAELGL